MFLPWDEEASRKTNMVMEIKHKAIPNHMKIEKGNRNPQGFGVGEAWDTKAP